MYNTDLHTTIKESKMLLNLGVSSETASYQYYKNHFGENRQQGIPVWGLWDLASLLPQEIKYKGNFYTLNLTLYTISYDCWYSPIDNIDIEIVFNSYNMKNNLLDAITWMKENNIPLKNEITFTDDAEGDFRKLLSTLGGGQF